MHPAYIWGFPTRRFVRLKIHLFNRTARAETQAQPASQALKQTRKPAASAVYVSCRLFLPGRIGATNNFPKGKHMNLRKTFLALAAMILGVGFLGAFPQQAQAAVPTCATVDSASHTYPKDNVHAITCLPAGYSNPVSGSKATIENNVWSAIQGLPTNGGSGTKRVRDFLKDQGVKCRRRCRSATIRRA